MDQIRQVLQSFGVSWASFIASVLNFSILLFILHRFAYKPLMKVMEERKRQIDDSLAKAKQIDEELKKTQQARDEVLTSANQAAQRMIDEARQAAEKFKDQKLNEAILAAQEAVKKAQEASRLERERMMNELRREMVNLVISTTSKVVGRVLTPEDEKRLSDETLRELAVR